MVEKAIYAVLSTEPEVTSIVSNRSFPVVADQDAALPFIAVSRKSTDRKHTLSGESHNLPVALMHLTCWATTHQAARDLADVLLQVFDGLSGTHGGVEVHKTFIEDEFDGFDFLTDGKEKPAYSITVALRVWYREPA